MDRDFNKGVAYVGGAYVPIEEAAIPILDWGFLRSDANQDTITVWKGMFFRLDDHLARFDRNIARLRMKGENTSQARRDVVFECVGTVGSFVLEAGVVIG